MSLIKLLSGPGIQNLQENSFYIEPFSNITCIIIICSLSYCTCITMEGMYVCR